MTEHLSTRQLEGYRDRSLSAAELLSACDHVAGCESCASRLAADVPVGPRVELLRADIEAGREPRHLSYEELADLVDGRLHPVDREIVESHLSLCGPCTEEARDLALAARRVEGRSSPRRPAVRFVAALAAAATLVSFAWLVDRALRVDGLRKQVAALQPANRTLGEEAPAIPLPPAKVWPPPMTLVDQGGRRVALDANGELTGLPALDPSLRVAVERALSTGEVQTPAFVAALVGHAETLLGPQEAGSFALLSPVGTAVSTDRPTFSWRPLSGGATYTVAVFDSRNGLAAVSSPLSATEWRLERPVPRGREYAWQVTAIHEGRELLSPAPPAPPARFRILEPSRLAELERAKASSAGSHLVLGVVYAQAGLLEDSERELRELLRVNSGSDVARRLLRSVEARRRAS